MNHMPKFEFNPTVNKSEKSILLKLRISQGTRQWLCDASEYEK